MNPTQFSRMGQFLLSVWLRGWDGPCFLFGRRNRMDGILTPSSTVLWAPHVNCGPHQLDLSSSPSSSTAGPPLASPSPAHHPSRPLLAPPPPAANPTHRHPCIKDSHPPSRISSVALAPKAVSSMAQELYDAPPLSCGSSAAVPHAPAPNLAPWRIQVHVPPNGHPCLPSEQTWKKAIPYVPRNSVRAGSSRKKDDEEDSETKKRRLLLGRPHPLDFKG